jgi:Predicted phosphotransferase related to Ser/Thr protein kinases
MPATNDRAATRLAWVRSILGDPALTLESASADASFRSYWRTQHQGRSWIVMDSPPAQEDPRPWLEIGARLVWPPACMYRSCRRRICSRVSC